MVAKMKTKYILIPLILLLSIVAGYEGCNHTYLEEVEAVRCVSCHDWGCKR